MSPSARPDPLSPVPSHPGGGDGVEPSALRSGRELLAKVTRGVRLAQGGMLDQTLALLSDAHRRLRDHPVAESATVMPGVLLNLGLAQTLRGRFEEAEEHLHKARSLAEERRLELMGLVVRQNLGCLSLYRGDTPTAIATFHSLIGLLPPERREALHVDLAEALLAEGLVEEAAAALADGAGDGESSGSANTMLVEAKLRLLRGDHHRTVELTRRVRHMFGATSMWYRPATRLERIALRSARARASAPVLRAHTALTVRRPFAAPEPPSGTAPQRALKALEGAASLAPGPWLAQAREDPDVVRAGLESALTAGDAGTALEWAELARTWAVPHVPGPDVRTPVTASLSRLYRRALTQGHPTAPLVRALESARWQAHHEERAARPANGPRKGRTFSPVAEVLPGRLGDRAFVRYTQTDGQAWALVVAAGRVHVRALGPVARVARLLAGFVHSVSFPGLGAGPDPRTAAEAVSRVLLRPLSPLLGDRPLVVAGDPYLGDPPWGMLPGLRGRPVQLVPTARFWLDRVSRGTPRSRGRVLLVAAHEPSGAGHEVAGLSRLLPGARVLTGGRAGRLDVLEAFGQADLVHLAGHGRVPDRSPMLASITLHDGSLLAYDLASPSRVPHTVILSTCGSGRGFAGRAGAPLGFAGALLAAGVRTVVASPVPVEDHGTGGAMVRFHRALVSGTPLPEAVAAHLGPLGFCCFGV